jgi:hypothetical protein
MTRILTDYPQKLPGHCLWVARMVILAFTTVVVPSRLVNPHSYRQEQESTHQAIFNQQLLQEILKCEFGVQYIQ